MMGYELNVFEQALNNPKTNTALNEWLSKQLDEKLATNDAKWENRLEKMDAKWEARFKEMDAKWEARFEKMEAKLDSRQEFIEYLKDQNNKLQEQLISALKTGRGIQSE